MTSLDDLDILFESLDDLDELPDLQPIRLAAADLDALDEIRHRRLPPQQPAVVHHAWRSGEQMLACRKAKDDKKKKRAEA